MGLRKDPTWEEDSFGYINSNLTEENINVMVDLDEDISDILHNNLWELYEE